MIVCWDSNQNSGLNSLAFVIVLMLYQNDIMPWWLSKGMTDTYFLVLSLLWILIALH